MRIASTLLVIAMAALTTPALALSLAPEEFKASRDMACVLAQQELGMLGEEEYGSRTHDVLDGFDESERDTILAKALGYYDGLMFAIGDDKNAAAVAQRLEEFVASSTCNNDFMDVTTQL